MPALRVCARRQQRSYKTIMIRIVLFLAVARLVWAGAPPGVVIDHQLAASGQYIGSPSLAVLRDGTYIAAHDLFGPESGMETSGITRLFASGDRGRSWSRLAEIHGQFWSTLFVHGRAVYLIGTRSEYGDAVIRRSDDGGVHWTEPNDETSGVLYRGRYHCAPVPVVEHDGRLWRAMEDREGGTRWGEWFRAMMLSAPAGADLLQASNWTKTNALGRDASWLNGEFGGWLEGNPVVAPGAGMVDFLRVDSPHGGKAAMLKVSRDGRLLTFDARTGFVDFPGGASKFTIRYDARSQRYWSLVNVVEPEYRTMPAGTVRNTVALVSSPDLRKWEVRRVVLHHQDAQRHAFQYLDWQFDGGDLIAVARTAWDGEAGGAHRYHDANYLTFHRIPHFRRRGEER